MKKIDLNQWERKEHYLFFSSLDIPQYSITFDVDISHLYQFVKDKSLSFYFTFMFCVMKTVNQIDAFKYRVINHEIYLFDVVHPSFTDMMENSNLFKIVNSKMHFDLLKFIEISKKASLDQKTYFDLEKGSAIDQVYITSLPWGSFTSLHNAGNVDKNDAIPRISWGKFRTVDHKLVMPIALKVHHGFVDGYHLKLFLETLDSVMNQIIREYA